MNEHVSNTTLALVRLQMTLLKLVSFGQFPQLDLMANLAVGHLWNSAASFQENVNCFSSAFDNVTLLGGSTGPLGKE